MLSAAKEKRQHGSMQVPYSYYDCRMPDYFPGVPLHWHGEMELNYIKRGTGYFQYEDRLLTAHAGDIFLIQPNLVHAILPAEQESMFYDTIVFHQNMLIGGYDDRSYTEILQPFFSARRRIQAPISPEHSGYAALSASVHQIFRCIRENSAVSDLLLKSELLRFFYLLAASPELCTDRPAMPAAAENLRPVLAYIQEHFADPITIEELARLSHLSKSYFMSCFKQTFGLGAVEYLTQLRSKPPARRCAVRRGVCPKSRTTMVSATFPTSTGSSETKWDVRRRCIGRNFKIRKFKKGCIKICIPKIYL